MEYLRATERFKQFPLQTQDSYVLPVRHGVIADRLTGSLTLVNWQDERFIAICELDDEQFSVVFTLLEQWPSCVPYEQLLRQLGIEPTGQDLADLEFVRMSGQMSRSRVQAKAQARTRLQPTLQKLRDLLSSSRACLNTLGIDIAAVQDHGPILIRYVEARALVLVEQSAG